MVYTKCTALDESIGCQPSELDDPKVIPELGCGGHFSCIMVCVLEKSKLRSHTLERILRPARLIMALQGSTPSITF
jgi:hypothetical protein